MTTDSKRQEPPVNDGVSSEPRAAWRLPVAWLVMPFMVACFPLIWVLGKALGAEMFQFRDIIRPWEWD